MKLYTNNYSLGSIKATGVEYDYITYFADQYTIRKASKISKINFSLISDGNEVKNAYLLIDSLKKEYNIEYSVYNTRVFCLSEICLTWLYDDIAKLELSFIL